MYLYLEQVIIYLRKIQQESCVVGWKFLPLKKPTFGPYSPYHMKRYNMAPSYGYVKNFYGENGEVCVLSQIYGYVYNLR